MKKSVIQETQALSCIPNGYLHRLLQEVLTHRKPDPQFLDHIRAEIFAEIDHIFHRAFTLNETGALHEFHYNLYYLYTRALAMPWDVPELNLDHPFVLEVRQRMEDLWESHELINLFGGQVHIPTVEDFAAWVVPTVQSHPSNVFHELFSFLRDHASFQQLREFILQETPFDIYFADLLATMLPGMYGPMKMELAANYWDEMGNGVEPGVHRNLRLRMMSALEIPGDLHWHNPEQFIWEELALANLYFQAAFCRHRLPQLIGMMLATEAMVPGRVDYQIQGWRRVGLDETSLEYLVLHSTVDIDHADGWLNHLTLPLIQAHPQVLPEIVLGVNRRLNAAKAVCDCMLRHLPSLR